MSWASDASARFRPVRIARTFSAAWFRDAAARYDAQGNAVS